MDRGLSGIHQNQSYTFPGVRGSNDPVLPDFWFKGSTLRYIFTQTTLIYSFLYVYLRGAKAQCKLMEAETVERLAGYPGSGMYRCLILLDKMKY